jgi:hypothetical protein
MTVQFYSFAQLQQDQLCNSQHHVALGAPIHGTNCNIARGGTVYPWYRLSHIHVTCVTRRLDSPNVSYYTGRGTRADYAVSEVTTDETGY